MPGERLTPAYQEPFSINSTASALALGLVVLWAPPLVGRLMRPVSKLWCSPSILSFLSFPLLLSETSHILSWVLRTSMLLASKKKIFFLKRVSKIKKRGTDNKTEIHRDILKDVLQKENGTHFIGLLGEFKGGNMFKALRTVPGT